MTSFDHLSLAIAGLTGLGALVVAVAAWLEIRGHRHRHHHAEPSWWARIGAESKEEPR